MKTCTQIRVPLSLLCTCYYALIYKNIEKYKNIFKTEENKLLIFYILYRSTCIHNIKIIFFILFKLQKTFVTKNKLRFGATYPILMCVKSM